MKVKDGEHSGVMGSKTAHVHSTVHIIYMYTVLCVHAIVGYTCIMYRYCRGSFSIFELSSSVVALCCLVPAIKLHVHVHVLGRIQYTQNWMVEYMYMHMHIYMYMEGLTIHTLPHLMYWSTLATTSEAWDKPSSVSSMDTTNRVKELASTSDPAERELAQFPCFR